MTDAMTLEQMDGLIEELNLGPSRGGRRLPKTPVTVEVVRELTAEDIPLLAAPPAVQSVSSIPQMRAQHHQLAGLIARGISNAEISLITGYSPSYISMLKSAPDMQELVDYYSSQAEERCVDALARLKALGLSSVEELQTRLNEAPEKFTNNQLMDLVEVGLLKPASVVSFAKMAAGGQLNAGGVQINLNFKAPEPKAEPGILLEGTAK